MFTRTALGSGLSRRVIRVGGGLVAVTLGVATLSACNRPLPEVSVLSGSTVVRVQPQTYIFSGSKDARVTSGTVGSIRAVGGSQILVDVPREVASQQWSVSAISLDAQGKQTSVDSDGASSPKVTHTHTTRVLVPYATGNYFLKIASAGTDDGGVWLVQVTITG
jgi:hypothetical protein